MNQMTDLDLAYTPATTLVQMINNKQISPVEVIKNCLERIEEVNSRLNCFCFKYPQEAIEKARQAEQAVAAGIRNTREMLRNGGAKITGVELVPIY